MAVGPLIAAPIRITIKTEKRASERVTVLKNLAEIAVAACDALPVKILK